MKFFGAAALNPYGDDVDTVPAPVGQPCGHCGELIAAEDTGWLIPSYDGSAASLLPFHHACHLRGIVGSVAHQEKRCSCYIKGSTEEDDPTLTRRQAAEAAMRRFYGR